MPSLAHADSQPTVLPPAVTRRMAGQLTGLVQPAGTQPRGLTRRAAVPFDSDLDVATSAA